MEKSFLEKNFKINFSQNEINKSLMNDLSIVAEGLIFSKSELTYDKKVNKYQEVLLRHGIELDMPKMQNMKSGMDEVIDLEGFSEEFIKFVDDYSSVISSISNYESYKSFINIFKANSDNLDIIEERQLAFDILFTTDILYQTMIVKHNTNKSNNAKISDYQYQCIGKIGLGPLTGCGFGG